MFADSTQEVDHSSKLPMHGIYRSIPHLMLANFMAGIAWGIGSLVGGTVIVALIGFILARTLELPTISELIDATVTEIQQQPEEGPE